ncbi:GNAT family N-acetyltransferase [Cupriavidus taiwanensis]|uniref:GNAT family N-acetyltransferase n=1 Tax=Cupriavidus taiwanensis TaxID=164546 RepID=UPI000E10265A|nr:GNAT family N-acetyltransferase [Cupriavidus taiwanensis]SPA50915.1 putative acetyltransferase, GCN5-related N-acetyltransferase family [Cupriavidus taiwanensis]
MEIRLLTPDDAAAFHALRLQGLAEAPEAFAASLEEEQDLAPEAVAQRLAPSADKAMFGAFEAAPGGIALAGMVGVMREPRRKHWHKASIFGMYVAPAWRARKLGRALMLRALQQAAAMPGVRQVTLCVNAGSAGAVRLYESLGFERFGLEPDALYVAPHFHDKLDMVLRLPAAPARPDL